MRTVSENPTVPQEPEQPADDAQHVEVVTHALLRLIADHPGRMGRLRAARVLVGLPVAQPEPLPADYAVASGWSIRQTVELVDALIAGGLAATTVGARPVLVLTRAGYRALEALERPPAR